MKESKLLKSIEEDTILKQIIENVTVVTEHAQSFPQRLEVREAELKDKLEHYYEDIRPSNILDIEEIEKSVTQVESRSDIESKLAAIWRLKGISWTNDKDYREALAQYYTYITPILTEMEDEKQKSRNKIAEIKSRYDKELEEAYKEFNSYENRIKDFFRLTGDISIYTYQVEWCRQFGNIARSDDMAISRANFYSEPIMEKHERKPKITNHQSISEPESLSRFIKFIKLVK